MADRSLLPKHFLPALKEWLVAQGFQHRPGRGHHQVLQIQLTPPQWHVLYERETRNPHYTVPEPLREVITRFIFEHKYGNHHSTQREQVPSNSDRPFPEEGVRPAPEGGNDGSPAIVWSSRDPATWHSGRSSASDAEAAGDRTEEDDPDPPF